MKAAAPSVRRRLPRRWARRVRWLAVFAGYLALAVVLLYPATPGGPSVLGAEDLLYLRAPLTEQMPAGLTRPSNAFLADAVEVFRPDLQWARERIRSGGLPLWNAGVFTGFPQLASQQTAILWPPNALAYVLPFFDGLALAILLSIALAAFGAFALCRWTLRLRAPSAILAGTSYAFGSYLVSWLEHPHHHAWALMPWALVATDRAVRSGRRRDVGLLAAVFGLLALAGHPQSALMAAMLVVAFALHRIRALDADRLRAASRVVAAGLLGFAAGAVVLLPFAELLGQSVDASRASAPLPRSALLALVFPELWGRPDWLFEGTGPANFLERTFYIGVAPLALAAVAVAARRHRDTWFFMLAGAAALLIAIDTPILATVTGEIPPFSLVAVSRLLAVASLCLAVLAAMGLDVLLRHRGRLPRTAVIAPAALLAAPLGWLMIHSPELRAIPSSLTSLSPFGEAADQLHAGAGAALRWMALAAIAAAMLIASRRVSAGRRNVVAAAVVAFAVIDLVTLGRGFHPAIDRTLLQANRTPGIELAAARHGHDRVIGDSEFLIPNAHVRYGLRDPRGHGLPVLRRVQRLYAAYGGFGYQATRFYIDKPDAKRLMDAFGVRVLLTGSREADPSVDGLHRLLSGPDERVYDNPGALPRAYVASSWRPAGSEAAGRAMTVGSSTPQLRDQPIVEGVAPPAPTGGTVHATARFVVDDDDRVRLGVQTDRAGRLVLLDSYYPGWTATVNGRPVSIAATNAAFRSVPVPAGPSVVEFAYRPASVLVGASISLVAWLAILTLIAVRRRNRPRPVAGPRSTR